jgi:hypothetical protein
VVLPGLPVRGLTVICPVDLDLPPSSAGRVAQRQLSETILGAPSSVGVYPELLGEGGVFSSSSI